MKKIVSIGICLMMMTSTFVFFSSTSKGFSGNGSGTVEDPYQVTNISQLQEIDDGLTSHYILMNDIDASDTATWNSGAGFNPIGGNPSPFFTGTFDGQGYIISNLTINRSSDYVGLFSVVYDASAKVSNVSLVDASISGSSMTGGIVGYLRGSIGVFNCSVEGTISSDSTDLGGIAGYVRVADISKCQTDVILATTGSSVGGIAGYLNDDSVTVSKCFSKGTISGGDDVGGIAGHCEGNVHNSYSIANVSGNSKVGGLIGSIPSSSSTVYHCYSTGYVTGSTNVGGLVGSEGMIGDATNSYWNNQTSGQTSSATGTAKTTAMMTEELYPNCYIDWDFTDIWRYTTSKSDQMGNTGYPALFYQDYLNISTDGVTELEFNDVTCTEGDTINVNLLITPDVPFDTVQILEISYTTSKINCTGFTWGNLFDGATIRTDPTIDDTSGYINDSLWSYTNDATEPGYYLNFTFETYQPGTAYVNISYDGLGIANNGIDLDKNITNNATITIQPGNRAPEIGSPDPADEAINQNISFTWQVPISDPDNDLFNWSIECNGYSNSTTDDTNGTKSLFLSDLDYSTIYSIYVNATDGELYSNGTFTFTTLNNTPPVLSNENPLNGSTGQDLELDWSIDITDDENIDWSIECTNGQTNNSTNDLEGTKTLALSGLSELTTYILWVNVSDGIDSVSNTYTFTTGASELWVDDDADPSWYDSTHLDNIPDAIDTIFNNGTINVYNGTYTLTDELYIDRPMNLIGENKDQTIIQRSGGNEHRLLTIEDIWDNYVTVDGFTFQGGYANMTNRNGIGGNILIVNSLNATVNNSIIKDGFAEQYGGGVQLEAGGNLKNSTIYDCDVLNSGMNGGGGISMRYGGNIVENCFITNCSGPVGGGILLKMGAYPPNQNQIIHCTIANNTAHGYFTYYGGGIASQGSGWTTSEIHDSIVYHNSPNNIMDVDGSLNIYYSCMTPLWGGSGNNNTDANPNFLYDGEYYEYSYYSFNDISSCWQNASDSLNRGAWQSTNQAPVFGTPDPADEAINQEVAFDWEISISDPDSDLFDWTIESSTGHSNSGTDDTDGIKSVFLICDFSTTYTVWVNASDDSLTTSDSFTFTTKANTPPSIGSPTPANNSINQSLSLTWSIPVDDPEHNLTTTIECSNGDSITYTDVFPNTYSLDLSDLGYDVSYTVYVNSTDGIDTTREWFTFTTITSNPPVLSNPSPSDGATDVSVECPNFNIQIDDPEDNLFDWSIEVSNGDSFSGTADTDGTLFCWFPDYLDYNTTYTVWVNVTENTNLGLSVNEVYTFTTEDNTPPTVELNFPINLTDYLSVYNMLFNCTIFDDGPEQLTVEFYINSTLGLRTGYVHNATSGEVEFYLSSLGGTWWLTHFIDHEWWVVVDDGTNRIESEHWTFQTSAPADINEDRKVDYLDISRLVDDYGESGWFMPGEIGEDIIEDGAIQYQDVSSMVFNYMNEY